MKFDCLGQEIKVGSKVLWSAHNSHSGFEQGVMRVASLPEKNVRIQNLKNNRLSSVSPSSLVVVDLNLAAIDKSLKIKMIYGNCPVQAEGLIAGQRFYFRARGESWSFSVGQECTFTPDWMHKEAYPGGQHEAGWMTEAEAKGFILLRLN